MTLVAALHRGESKDCFGVTEPNNGQKTLQSRTTAVRRRDRYVVSREEIWISTAHVAHKILLLARTTPLAKVRTPIEDLSLLFIDLDRSRIEMREIEKLLIFT